MSNKDRVKSELTVASLRKRAIKELIIGAVVAACAGMISYASYNAAATSRTGGTYTVYTGAIALGVVYAIKGGFTLLFPNLVLKWSKKAEAKSAEKSVAQKATAKAVVEPEEKPEAEKIEF